MPAPDLDPILIQVTVPLPIPMIFKAFLDAKELSEWLCDSASVVPEAGGRYELHFDSEVVPFVSAGRIARITPDVELEFGWVPPTQYQSGVENSPMRSQVYVRLQESPEGIDVTLEHSGWKGTEEGEEARSWHFRFWDARLHDLKDYLLKTAYG